MSELNAVAKTLLDLYPGDDTLFFYTPDTSLDQSGLPVANWNVVVGFYLGRVELGQAIHTATIQFGMTWNPTTMRFEGTLPRAALLGMAPGRWTGGIWRTNLNSSQLLLVLETTVVPTVIVTTTSSTTTTTTTT